LDNQDMNNIVKYKHLNYIINKYNGVIYLPRTTVF